VAKSSIWTQNFTWSSRCNYCLKIPNKLKIFLC